MKKILLMLVLLAGMAVPVHAAGCDSISVSGLPESTVIELKKKCIDMQNIKPAVSIDNLGEYAELGKKYGVALSEVAKSIGTTVNDLAKTPVGQFMLVMVAYKVMGNDLLGIVGSFLWFTTMIPLWIYMFHRMVLSTRGVRETLDHSGKVTGRVINPVNWHEAPGVIAIVMVFVMVFICISGFIMAFG